MMLVFVNGSLKSPGQKADYERVGKKGHCFNFHFPLYANDRIVIIDRNFFCERRNDYILDVDHDECETVFL